MTRRAAGSIMTRTVVLLLAVLALPDIGEPISGRVINVDPNVLVQRCVGARIERIEVLNTYPQQIERLRVVLFCTTDRWYQLLRATAMRVDGVIGQPFSNEREMLCEVARPEPENKAKPEILRERP